MRIRQLRGREVLDSRGRPTVAARCEFNDGSVGYASIPSGSSRGSGEAVEVRDGDAGRYNGLGCRTAARNVTEELGRELTGMTFPNQQDLDTACIELDGTSDKSRLGANALLAVSLSFARAAATSGAMSLYSYLAQMGSGVRRSLPQPTINLFSGGAHAGFQIPIQDVLIVPRFESLDVCLSSAASVYDAAASLVERRYGMRRLKADEGGLAPPATSVEDLLEDAVSAITDAGYEPGVEVALAIDVASGQFTSDGRYILGDRALEADEMVDLIAAWVNAYPIMSVEDGLSDDSWNEWPELCRAIGDWALVVGDDLLCSNRARVTRARETAACNALLLKVNQVGTVSEAHAALEEARSADWTVIASARSGETEDDWLADLAVGWNADQLKVGSLAQSDRLAKYNRLLAIAEEVAMPVGDAYARFDGTQHCSGQQFEE